MQKVPRHLAQGACARGSALCADGDPGLSRVIPAQFRQRMSLEQGLRQQKAAKPNYSKENKSERED